MSPFTRGNLAVVERELRKCIENLRVPVERECTLTEAATRVHYALREAQSALEELDRAIRLEEMAEARE